MAVTKIVRRGEVAHNVKARRDSRPSLTKEGDAAYKLPIEELKAKADAQLKKSDWQDRLSDTWAEMTVFLEHHPEFAKIDARNDATSAANSKALLAEIYSPEGKTAMNHARRSTPNFWDMDMAFERAKAKGLLVLDQGELQQRQLEATRQRVSGQVDLDPETMPMDQLRRLANGIFDPLGPR